MGDTPTNIQTAVNVAHNIDIENQTNNIGNQTNITINREATDNQCLKDLRETDPRDDKTRIENTKGGLLRDCYRWILDDHDYQRWRDDPQSRLLWIKGDAGKGKTMLLCGILNELSRSPERCCLFKKSSPSPTFAGHISFFFCQCTDSRLNHATAILRGLIYLLLCQIPSLISHIQQRYDHAGRQLFEDTNAFYTLSQVLADMLQDCKTEKCLMVIDALDECVTGLQHLLSFITRSTSTCPYVKWIVSSRNRHEIEQQLHHYAVTFSLELNADPVARAINTYINYKVAHLVLLREEKSLQDKVRDVMRQKADGTFLWVALAAQELESVQSWNMLNVLNQMPAGLEPLYRQMMIRIRQMGEQELRDSHVSLIHQSAKDFLTTVGLTTILPQGLGATHETILLKSLEIISKAVRRDIYNLGQPGVLIDDIRQPEPDPLAQARYPCMYWVNHLNDAVSDGNSTPFNYLQDDGIVHRFLKTKYLYWLEALSLLRSIPEAVAALTKLETLLVKPNEPCLYNLAQDALRFILSHGWIIGRAPLQAYASALIFSPQNSIIRSLFRREEPSWVATKPAMEADWTACRRTLEAHTNWVSSVAFSADGQKLASGSWDETVRIWDTVTGSCMQVLYGHKDEVTSVAFSADSQRLATGSRNGSIKVWDAATGRCIQTLEGHDKAVCSVAFLAKGWQIISGSYDATVKIWDAMGTPQTLQNHPYAVTSIDTSVSNQWIASGLSDGTVKVWDTIESEYLWADKGHTKSVSSVAFSGDGEQLASGSTDAAINIWNARNGERLHTFSDHSDEICSVAFSKDGRLLLSGSYDKAVKIWDAKSGTCMQTLDGHGYAIFSVAFSANDQQIASGSGDYTIKIWDRWMGISPPTLESHDDTVASIAISAGSRWLASGSWDKTVKLWDITTGACAQTPMSHGDTVVSVAFSADSRWLASSATNGTIKIWDLKENGCIWEFRGHNGTVFSVDFSLDGEQLASGALDGTIKIWEPANRKCVWTVQGHTKEVFSIAFSKDGKRLASGSADTTIKLWEPAGERGRTFGAHQYSVTSVAFSADGQWLASGSHDETIKIWNVEKRLCVQLIHVRRVVSHLTFDLNSNQYLSTDIGILELDQSAMHTQSVKNSTEEPQYHGYRINPGKDWIMKELERLLWLPPEYRPAASAVAGSTVAFGCYGGRVFAVQLSTSGSETFATYGASAVRGL
ncbi:unnamed protein product [Clonostachys rosea f. rosea IK726]|uniref:Uncharacterized protein n=1 Tax=Clonostachys rosea f. rosea IK726 TaxID=1349383 RepID=A0ACA9UEK9_BIOOC|nr:unnamed protein product [Clonostachys rosea f. rosea IK726]